MSAADELDEVPDAASPDASASKLRRDARQLFREKHGRDLDTLHKSSLDAEEELHKCVLHTLRAALQKREGRDPTLAEYQAACESEGIPAAVLQSHLFHRGTAESLKLARAAFFKEHGREATSEERQKFLDAAARDDPMDHVGPVEAEEANMYGEIARLKEYISASEPTDDEIFEKACIEARAFRRAALEAVNPDVAAVRRILVSRNVAAAKRDDAPPAVAFGPPPRPEDADAAETPFEEAARLEHEKVLVVAAAAYQSMCALDDDAATGHHQTLRELATSDETWDKQTEVARGVISGLSDEAPCRIAAERAVAKVIKSGYYVSPTVPYATSYAVLLERLAREILDPGSEHFLQAGKLDLPSLSSDDAADITLTFESTSWDDEDGCIGFARRMSRLNAIGKIYDAVLEKKERDAAVEREAARVRLKQQEASSRKAEADLLALLDAEDEAAAAPKSKSKKKKKKKKRGESPVPAPAPTPAAAPETKAAAPEAPAAPADAAAEEKAPETDASEAAPEDATEEAPSETAPPPEAPESEPDADAPPSATGERRRSLADLAAAEATPTDAPPEEDAWETVARRPRQTAATAPPPRRRSDHADAPKHSIDDLLALEATGGALTDHALRKIGAFGGRCYVTQKGEIYQPITEPRRRHSSEGSEARRRAGSRVFVHNVRGLTEQVIWRIFDDPRVGRVVRVQMQTDDAGAPRNYCFVDYEDATSATLAIQCLDAHVVGGRSLRVEVPRADAPPASAPDASGPASLLPLLAPKGDASPAVEAPSPSPQIETTPPPPPPTAPGLDPDVARFLDNLGLAGVGPILAREEIDWETLGLLDAEGLADAGIPRDDAQFIIVAYASLGGAPPTPAAAAPRPAPPAAPVAAAPAPTAAPGTPDRDECPICFEPEKSTALVPCGHILCGACAAKYAHCPVCREVVSSRMRVFW